MFTFLEDRRVTRHMYINMCVVEKKNNDCLTKIEESACRIDDHMQYDWIY